MGAKGNQATVARIIDTVENISMDDACPFCEVANVDRKNRVVLRNQTAIAFRDGYPISEGHTLIVPVRHVSSFFDIFDQEHKDLFELLKESKLTLEKEFGTSSFNIGINDGQHAGHGRRARSAGANQRAGHRAPQRCGRRTRDQVFAKVIR